MWKAIGSIRFHHFRGDLVMMTDASLDALVLIKSSRDFDLNTTIFASVQLPTSFQLN